MQSDLWREIRYAARSLAANPGFALAAIATLGLGIGANTAVFSAINGVLLNPLPYGDGERLLVIRQSAPRIGQSDIGVSIAELYSYRQNTSSFDAVAEYHQMNFDLLIQGEADRINVGVVSSDLFPTLGVQPMLGRTFTAADDAPGAEAVLILSHSYWSTKFGADPGVIGRVVEMNDRAHTIIGVLPNLPMYPEDNDVFMPTSSCPFRTTAEGRVAANHRAFPVLTAVAKLKAGVSPEAAERDVKSVAARFTSDHPQHYDSPPSLTATTISVRDELVRNARPMLLVLSLVAGMVLLIACANVANLAVSRWLRRDSELAIRQALGADRTRLLRHALTESLLLALTGGAVGLAVAAAVQSVLVRLIGQVTNRTGDISIDGSVLAFAAAISLATGVVFGAAPAFAARKDFAALLRSTRGGTLGRARQRIHRGLIVLQLSVSLVLLVSAGLLLASFERLQNVDVGYDGENVLSAEVFGNFSKYPDVPSLQRLYEIIVDRLRGQPAVQAVAVTNSVPLSTTQPGTSAFMVQGHAMEAATVYPTADQRVVTPDYFATLGVRLLDGRDFDDFDTSSNEPVAIVNDTMRQQYWPRPSAIGGRISFDEGKSWRTVVGVAPDLKQFGLDHGAVMQVYVPLAQHSRPVSGRIMIRTETDPLSASAMLRQNVLAIDAALPVENVQTLAQLREQQLSTPRFASILLIAFAVVALAITMVGLAGVIALYVNQRVREFGVRMALGGHASHVVRLVMREALALLALGVVGGLLGAIVVTRILSTYLFDTPAMDPLVIAGAVLLLALAASAACLAPALRATRVPILIVLQSE